MATYDEESHSEHRHDEGRTESNCHDFPRSASEWHGFRCHLVIAFPIHVGPV